MRKQKEKKVKEQISSSISSAQSSNESPAPLERSFISSQSFGKAKQRVKKNLPKSPEKRKVICHLVSTLSPSSKSQVYKKARLMQGPMSGPGRPSMSEEQKEIISAFLKRQDIAYCKPCRKDTVNMEKDADGEKIYKE